LYVDIWDIEIITHVAESSERKEEGGGGNQDYKRLRIRAQPDDIV